MAKPFLGLGLSDYLEEFFVGITHDKNMARLADYFEANKVDFEKEGLDFFTKFGLSH